jgi:hypothetical protein
MYAGRNERTHFPLDCEGAVACLHVAGCTSTFAWKTLQTRWLKVRVCCGNATGAYMSFMGISKAPKARLNRKLQAEGEAYSS